MSQVLNQVVAGASVGDAITDQALLMQRWLRRMGVDSTLYAEYIHPVLEHEVRSIFTYTPRAGERHIILHHSIGSASVNHVLSLPIRCVMVYHNITPPEFFASVDPDMARQMRLGREQLLALRPRTDLALADSAFNERELVAMGYARTGVLPIALDPLRYNVPTNQQLADWFAAQTTTILFVGRLTPNKKQEDLIKLLRLCQRVDPGARLILVGQPWTPSYERWLNDLTVGLGLTDSVILKGHAPWQDMVTCYRSAHVYVSMSEHEGFGKPLIESMYLGLPVLAYAAASIPETIGDASILFHRKDYEALAEWVDLLAHDAGLRQRVIDAQHARVDKFLEPRVEQMWRAFVETILR